MDQWSPSTIERVTWEKIRNDFAKCNQELAIIIDELSPDSSYVFYDTNYHYGDEVLLNGYLQIPSKNGDLSPLSSIEVDARIQEDLGYNLGTNPAGLVLKGSFELFLMFEKHTAPIYGLIPKNALFGLWRILSSKETCHAPGFIWNMTAGARSIFMLPKISEAKAHKKLTDIFNSDLLPPRKLIDQWNTFKEFSKHPNFREKWSARILFFSKKWFEKLDDPKWFKFKTYLLKSAWDGSDFWRNQFLWDVTFSIIQKNTNLRPNPQHMDITKHILTMAVGAVPGFSPAIDNSSAPISRLQELYQDIYRLEYAPTMMIPTFFSIFEQQSRPVYYSIEYPSTIEFSPSSRAISNKIIILSDVMRLLRKCTEEIKKNYLNLKGTPIYDLINQIKFDAFHMEGNLYQGIQNSSEIPKEDSSFLETKFCQEKKFPAKCPFVNGCIRISYKF